MCFLCVCVSTYLEINDGQLCAIENKLGWQNIITLPETKLPIKLETSGKISFLCTM